MFLSSRPGAELTIFHYGVKDLYSNSLLSSAWIIIVGSFLCPTRNFLLSVYSLLNLCNYCDLFSTNSCFHTMISLRLVYFFQWILCYKWFNSCCEWFISRCNFLVAFHFSSLRLSPFFSRGQNEPQTQTLPVFCF